MIQTFQLFQMLSSKIITDEEAYYASRIFAISEKRVLAIEMF